jgi:Prenyltransferase and squalene oxidase repeat
MKTTLRSSKLLIPLTGSICGLLVITTLAPLVSTPFSYADDIRSRRAGKAQTDSPEEPQTNPRSPDEALAKGIEYLLSQQHPDGGWGQGGGWRQSAAQSGTRVEGANVGDPSDLGNTCVSLVALLRSGNSPAQGAHKEEMAKAFDFICLQVEQADQDSLYVTSVRDTQLQVKIGVYVDTFLAGWALSELKGQLSSDAQETRRLAALQKVTAKIEHNQRDDGSFAGNNGWAAVLSQGLCSKALNMASRSGAKVPKETLDKDQKQNRSGLDLAKGDFSAPPSPAEPSNAGVSLYREGAKLDGLREKSKADAPRKSAAEKTISDALASTPAKTHARQELKEIAEDERDAKIASSAISGKLRDSRYTAGFGNNGGEEFLSYLNVTEGVREQGGKDWDDWREKMQKTVCGAQNSDGSWAGQHCITGRTFCTGAALMTLLVDRRQDAVSVNGIPTNAKTAGK